MDTTKYIEVWTSEDDNDIMECVCNEPENDDMSLVVDYENKSVICRNCGHVEKNWLITNLIDLYTPGPVSYDCEKQIMSFYYPENVEREELEINKSIEFLKTARLG